MIAVYRCPFSLPSSVIDAQPIIAFLTMWLTSQSGVWGRGVHSALSHLFLREPSIHHTAEPGPKKWQSSGRGGTWVPELLCGAVTPTTWVCHVSKKWNFLFLNSHCEFRPLCWSSLALTPTHTVVEVGHAPWHPWHHGNYSRCCRDFYSRYCGPWGPPSSP